MNELPLIGDNLKHHRKQKGITQKRAAEITGISQHYWNWVENNIKIPSVHVLHKMCNTIGVSMAEIFEKTKHPEQ